MGWCCYTCNVLSACWCIDSGISLSIGSCGEAVPNYLIHTGHTITRATFRFGEEDSTKCYDKAPRLLTQSTPSY